MLVIIILIIILITTVIIHIVKDFVLLRVSSLAEGSLCLREASFSKPLTRPKGSGLIRKPLPSLTYDKPQLHGVLWSYCLAIPNVHKQLGRTLELSCGR